MLVRRPEEMHRAFTTAFNASDLDALMALYEPEAILAPAPGQMVAGTEEIRAALEGLLTLRGQMRIETRRVMSAGGIALLHGSWTLVGTGPDGGAVELAGRDTEVVRRQTDGSWRFAFDNPFGDT